MTLNEMMNFYETKNEHYPISDDFVKKYQQHSGGYITNARKEGLEINPENAEPNQKWHFLVSYRRTKSDLNAPASELWKTGRGLKCPELLLWLAEAAGCDISEAKAKAEELCEKKDRLHACIEIKKIIPWETLENKIKNIS